MKLTLRRVRQSDGEAIKAILHQPGMIDGLLFDEPPKNMKLIIRAWKKSDVYVINYKKKTVGVVGFGYQPRCTMFFFLSIWYRRKGIMKMAIEKAIQKIPEQYIFANAYLWNIGSIKTLESCGFKSYSTTRGRKFFRR